MACMEHVCRKCGWTEFNNGDSTACPRCGGVDFQSFFDEDIDRDPPEHDDDDGDGDED